MGAKCAALNNYIDMKHEWKYNYIKMIAGKGRTNRLTAKKIQNRWKLYDKITEGSEKGQRSALEP